MKLKTCTAVVLALLSLAATQSFARAPGPGEEALRDIYVFYSDASKTVAVGRSVPSCGEMQGRSTAFYTKTRVPYTCQ